MSQEEIRFYFLLFAFFSLGMGACVGSFLNVCIYRIPREESVVKPRSHCPHCGMLIPWYLNIPVLSWLCLRGKCAKCGGPISFRYALVELLTALLFLAVYMKWAAPFLLSMPPLADVRMIPCYWLVISGLLVGTFIDFEHYILPDSVTIGGMIAGPLLSAAIPALHGATVFYEGLGYSLLGALVGFGLLYGVAELGERVFKKEAMGFGDVKLMGAIGAFLGWKAVLFTLFSSSLLGSLSGLGLIVCGKGKLQSRIPFGPYLAMGAMIWIFWGEALLNAYLRLTRAG